MSLFFNLRKSEEPLEAERRLKTSLTPAAVSRSSQFYVCAASGTKMTAWIWLHIDFLTAPTWAEAESAAAYLCIGHGAAATAESHLPPGAVVDIERRESRPNFFDGTKKKEENLFIPDEIVKCKQEKREIWPENEALLCDVLKKEKNKDVEIKRFKFEQNHDEKVFIKIYIFFYFEVTD